MDRPYIQFLASLLRDMYYSLSELTMLRSSGLNDSRKGTWEGQPQTRQGLEHRVFVLRATVLCPLSVPGAWTQTRDRKCSEEWQTLSERELVPMIITFTIVILLSLGMRLVFPHSKHLLYSETDARNRGCLNAEIQAPTEDTLSCKLRYK